MAQNRSSRLIDRDEEVVEEKGRLKEARGRRKARGRCKDESKNIEGEKIVSHEELILEAHCHLFIVGAFFARQEFFSFKQSKKLRSNRLPRLTVL